MPTTLAKHQVSSLGYGISRLSIIKCLLPDADLCVTCVKKENQLTGKTKQEELST